MSETLSYVPEDLKDAERLTLTPKQERFIFHKEFPETAQAKVAAYGGGVGNGKSFAGCIKVHNHCMENPGAFVLVGRRHATDLRDSTLKDFLALFGDYGVYKESEKKFTYPNGSEIIFRHLDDLRSLTNMNLSYYWVDQAEEVPEDAFLFLNGRIRRQRGPQGQYIKERGGALTFNMDGHNWIWRRLKMHRDTNGDPLKNPQEYCLIVATSHENPNLPADYREWIESMPKDWVDRFVYGSWDDHAGQIFSEWRPSVHVIDPFPIPNSWERFRSIDHGQNNPTACGWYAVDFDGNIYKYQEYYQEKSVVSEHVKNINTLSMIPTSDGRMVMDEYAYTLIDPSTSAKTRERNGRLFSVADEYYEAGIATLPAQNDVLAGINRCREYLTIDPARYHPTKTNDDGSPFKGAPKFFVFRGRCPNFEEEVAGYKWKPIKYGVEQNNHEAPVKKNDHSVDEWRYGIMSRPLAPGVTRSIDPRILKNPLELARYATKQGMTVDELLVSRLTGETKITHTDGGVTHSGGISHSYAE
jgi:hypothetical protein